MTDDGQILPFSRDLREALARYARTTWRTNTAKQAAQAWGLDATTAANLLKGHASDATITKVFRAGGWRVASVVISTVVGQTYEQFIASEIEAVANARRRLEEDEARMRARYEALRSRRVAGGSRLRVVDPEGRAGV